MKSGKTPLQGGNILLTSEKRKCPFGVGSREQGTRMCRKKGGLASKGKERFWRTLTLTPERGTKNDKWMGRGKLNRGGSPSSPKNIPSSHAETVDFSVSVRKKQSEGHGKLAGV